jgi:hypothetical protein
MGVGRGQVYTSGSVRGGRDSLPWNRYGDNLDPGAGNLPRPDRQFPAGAA